MAEEEMLIEVEAVKAVYGDDCCVLDNYPTHIHVLIKPRTADVSSQQFVEVVLGIQAGPEYPKELPSVYIIESKGLDEQRQNHLIASIHDKARELSSCLMLVALCEEAVERLSSMNHPDGNCALCMYPLVEEDTDNNLRPFMKLMSCFHCFHCDCIIRWWNWVQIKQKVDHTNVPGVNALEDKVTQQGMHGTMEDHTANCPVCRKIFHVKDIEHVLDLIDAYSKPASNDDGQGSEAKNLLQSDSEKTRRQKFEAILKLQQENSGLIEPKRNEVLLPGMFLPRSTTRPTTTSMTEPTEQREDIDPMGPSGAKPANSLNRPGSSNQRNSGLKKHRGRNPRRQVQHWIKKDKGTTD